MVFYDLLPKLVVIHRKIFFVEEGDNMNVRNEVKSYLVSEGVTMQEILSKLQKQYGWSDSISNLSGKLRRETLRYKEVLELADVLGYEIIWKKRR